MDSAIRVIRLDIGFLMSNDIISELDESINRKLGGKVATASGRGEPGAPIGAFDVYATLVDSKLHDSGIL